MAKRKAPAKPSKPFVDGIPLDAIDPAPAYSVREGQDTATVEEYAEAMRAGDEFPACDIFRYVADDTQFNLLADGGKRFEATRLAGKKRLPCLIRVCPDKETAEKLAFAHAAGSNAKHGKRRTPGDLRASVRAVIVRPEYADATDRDLYKLTLVSRFIVREVRTAMVADGSLTGPAADYAKRTYKVDAPAKRAHQKLKDGELVAARPAEPPPPEANGKPWTWGDNLVSTAMDLDPVILGKLHLHSIKTCGELVEALKGEDFCIRLGLSDFQYDDLTDKLAAIMPAEVEQMPPPAADEPDTTPDDEPEPDPVPPEYGDHVGEAEGGRAATLTVPESPEMRDECGRPIPTELYSVFADRSAFRSMIQQLGRVSAAVEKLVTSPGGEVLAHVVGNFRVKQSDNQATLSQTMPYVVCPNDKPDQPCQKACNRCNGSRWLSGIRFQQLPETVKRQLRGEVS